MFLVLFMLPACLMAFDRFIVKPDHEQKKNARLMRIHAKRLTFPVLTELQKQRKLLHEQLIANRRARRKALIARLQKLGKPQEKSQESEEQSDEKK